LGDCPEGYVVAKSAFDSSTGFKLVFDFGDFNNLDDFLGDSLTDFSGDADLYTQK
jgi:hypothetical protein